uniref:M23ase beta-sheet core domain-containing protein n=1 Tax=Phaeomonas parva TaxID=124430 RepID=A0A7S1TZ27_9STRA|mmetsp:Transcript_22206/g.68316  ORF Transcript_22206/g.68316 Transcript_22206/m.68316 type:complete len:265 (+) Transcript_22206:40-834(+)
MKMQLRGAVALLLAGAAAGDLPTHAELQQSLNPEDFHPAVIIPGDYIVRDFSQGPDGNGIVEEEPNGCGNGPMKKLLGLVRPKCRRAVKGFDVGKYNETRPGMYSTALFDEGGADIDGYGGVRNIHIGIDIGGPVMTPIHAVDDGTILHFGYNAAAGDYGHVIVTEHEYTNAVTGEDFKLYMLYGHLAKESAHFKYLGQKVSKGDVIAYMGPPGENGGWPEHLHFQLSLEPPSTHDMPGVVCRDDLDEALRVYPDPRLVLGPLY